LLPHHIAALLAHQLRALARYAACGVEFMQRHLEWVEIAAGETD
jgi:hypothetical protein